MKYKEVSFVITFVNSLSTAPDSKLLKSWGFSDKYVEALERGRDHFLPIWTLFYLLVAAPGLSYECPGPTGSDGIKPCPSDPQVTVTLPSDNDRFRDGPMSQAWSPETMNSSQSDTVWKPEEERIVERISQNLKKASLEWLVTSFHKKKKDCRKINLTQRQAE